MPDIETAIEYVLDVRFGDDDERTVVNFEEGQGRHESTHRQYKQDGDELGQEGPEDEAGRKATREIDKLFEGERSEDLILNLNKLRNFVRCHPLYCTSFNGFLVWVAVDASLNIGRDHLEFGIGVDVGDVFSA